MYFPDKLFLFYIYAMLPWMVLRGARRLRKLGTGLKASNKQQLGILVTQAVLVGMAVVTARSNGVPLRFVPESFPSSLLWLAVAAIPCVTWLAIRWRIPPATDAVLTPQAMAPHGRTRLILWVIIACSAGIFEEIVWRGVGTMLLAWYVGFIPGALISALGFGIVHAYQGKRGVAVTGAFALVAQCLIWVTGALLPAMVLHASYDIAAGFLLVRRYPLPEDSPLPG